MTRDLKMVMSLLQLPPCVADATADRLGVRQLKVPQAPIEPPSVDEPQVDQPSRQPHMAAVAAKMSPFLRRERYEQGQGCWAEGVDVQVMDMFVEQTHEVRHEERNNVRAMRFTDTRVDEQERAVSLKMVPISLVMQGSSGKSYLCNLIDTPGALHVSFTSSS